MISNDMKKHLTEQLVAAYEEKAPLIAERIKKMIASGATPKQVKAIAKRAGSSNPEAWEIIAEYYQRN